MPTLKAGVECVACGGVAPFHCKPRMKPEKKQRESGLTQDAEIGTGHARLNFGQICSFGQVLSLANEALLCVDSNRRVAFCNEAASSLWGWSCAEAVGMPFDLLLPERYRRERGRQGDPFAARSTIRVISRNRFCMSFLRKNGEEFQAEASVGRVRLGAARLLIFVVRDVGKRRKAEEALRLEAERFRVLAKNAPIMVAHQDRQLRYTWMHWPDSPFPRERVIGHTDADLFAPEEARRLTEMKLHVLHSAEGARAEMRTTAGGTARFHDLTIEPLLSAEGRIAGITCASWDVTAARRAERIREVLAKVGAALMQTPGCEQALANVARAVVPEFADCCMLELVAEGRTRRLRVAHRERSKAAWTEEMEHSCLEDGRGLGWAVLESRESTLLTNVGDAYLQSVAQDDAHLRLLRELAPVSVVAVPLIVREQLLGAMVLVASSAGRRFESEDLREGEEIATWVALAAENTRLQRSARRALEDRDETLGIVAHDLRSPLGVIENCARAIAMRLRQDGSGSAGHAMRSPEQANRLIRDLRQGSSTSVEQILRSSGDATRLIHDLLDASRKNGGHFPIERRRVRVEKLVAEVIETHKFAAISHPLSLELESGAPLPKAWCDRRRITQVLQNLLDNAAKFSPDGAPIVVLVSARRGELLVRVSDKGRGIPLEHLEHVFERYWHGVKSQHESTGLGLSICKEIVEAHGGRIWADSTPGVGSNFYFTIPAVPENPSLVGQAGGRSGPGSGGSMDESDEVS
jgi:PAS domain S-box-containing protein